MNKLLLAGVVACSLIGIDANAAVITWSSPQAITGDSDVSTLGSTVGAVHFSNPTADTTVNGVTFIGIAPPTATSITSGNFNLTTGNNFTGGSAGSASPPFSTLSSEYQALLGFFLGGSGGSPYTATLTINSLTIGTPYQFQWWFNRSAAGTGTSTATAGTSVTLSGNPSATIGGLGQFAIGTFVADSTIQTIGFTSNGAAMLNGFQLRVVPGPGSLALLGFAAIGMNRRRRR